LATKYLSEGGLLLFTGAAKLFKDAAPGNQMLKIIFRNDCLSNSENCCTFSSNEFKREQRFT